MHAFRPYCLSIAGFDPSGGAGIIADTKVFECLKTYGLGVVSALTYQNDAEFKGIRWCGFSEIKKQVMPLKSYPVKVVKIGLIESLDQLAQTTDLLKNIFPGIFIIWDPIIKASAGFSFHNDISLPERIIENVDLITPNFEEYTQLISEVKKELRCAILLKGGHRKEKAGVDTLFYENKSFDIEGEPFKDKKDKHGTGCVLSSAIAAYVAKGESLTSACTKAKLYVERFIKSNNTKLGYHYE